MDNTKDKKTEEDDSKTIKAESSKEEKPNKDLKPPRFYNLSEGVDPDKYSDKVVKEKEEKYGKK